MKMNVILMIVGIIIFAIGAILTFTDKKADKTNDNPSPVEVNVNVNNTSTVNSSTTVNHDQDFQNTSSSDPKQKGNEFEDFVANTMKRNNLTIQEWNKGTVTDEGAFAKNSLNPDMYILDKEGKVNLEYWIECKYRSNLQDNTFKLKDYQMKRYTEIQNDSHRKVLIALGLGGSPSKPERFFIIPLDSLNKFKFIPLKFIDKYTVSDPQSNLKTHIRDYFYKKVFKKSN